MNEYEISNIEVMGYTSEEINKIDEAVDGKRYNKFIKQKEEELFSSLGVNPECLKPEHSNYPAAKAESEIYNKNIGGIL